MREARGRPFPWDAAHHGCCDAAAVRRSGSRAGSRRDSSRGRISEYPRSENSVPGLARTDTERELFARALPGIIHALADGAVPDTSLINLERFIQAAPDSEALFRYLAENPRAVEILVRLFVGSQFLTRDPAAQSRLPRAADAAQAPGGIQEPAQFVDEEREATREGERLSRAARCAAPVSAVGAAAAGGVRHVRPDGPQES